MVRFSVYFGLIILKCYFSRGKNNCCSCTQIAIRILRNNKVHFLEFLRTAIKQIRIKKILRYKKVRFLEFLRKVMKENSFLRLVILISISGIPSVVDLYNVLHKYIILSKCPFCLRQVYLTHIPSPQWTFFTENFDLFYYKFFKRWSFVWCFRQECERFTAFFWKPIWIACKIRTLQLVLVLLTIYIFIQGYIIIVINYEL